MSEITVGSYIFERLKQLGVKSVFGVPGDYELALLDLVPKAGLTWRGNPNELNAGYAADGYARINGIGAVVTTFGPGELSNMCGIAGAYCEFVPVVHIVGYPTEAAQHGRNIMHHSLGEVGDGKFDVYHEMARHITCASVVLHDAKTAASEIDKVLNAMLLYSQPVYIGIPTEVALQSTPSINLSFPLTTALPPNIPDLETHVVSLIRAKLDAASSPIIIVDGGAIRHNVIPETEALIKKTGFVYFATSMGKGGITENLKTFGGVYGGSGSLPEIKKAVEGADCVLWVGNYPSDFNTGEFTEQVKEEAVVDFQRFYVKFAGVRYDVKMKYVLEALLSNLSSEPLSTKSHTLSWTPYAAPSSRPSHLTQDYLWATLGPYFRSNDLVIAETGTSAFGIPSSSIQHGDNIKMFNQTIFGSIGFATAAAVGAFVAGKENGSVERGILVTGEGSLQLTVQAFSDLLRHEVRATIFLLNNGGYTVERLIHGMKAPYNDVPNWDYGALLQAFGPSFKTKHFLVKTPDELDAVLADEEFNEAKYTQIVELILEPDDAPQSVVLTTAAIEEFNRNK
ncbi:putative pyruvate decarboxylase [Mollisia scopiformis]|uniref:Pyruvate decarboxylase n=1 Tax=Mollisia scopiformis TaxID=149040 RepID=A0A194X0I1_MOLSC|nr:putative pyruvate decarboxylase [Mollisia scopiformis]KUJ13706.1 putative pyruvate decarboxylase [Mollisia scopiformis]